MVVIEVVSTSNLVSSEAEKQQQPVIFNMIMQVIHESYFMIAEM